MASPVVINSSSPSDLLRVPSVTPPNLRQDLNTILSSSPRLPSPSAFVQPLGTRLQSGSNVQKVPEGASIGFRSARTLPVEHGLAEQCVEDVRHGLPAAGAEPDRQRNKATNTVGTDKLVKPRKDVDSGTDDTEPHEALKKSPDLGLAAYNGLPEADSSKRRAEVEQDVYQVPTIENDLEPIMARQKGTNIANHAHATAEAPIHVVATTKTRKKAVRPSDDGDGATAKKPRKRKVKSAAIIINSDESSPADAVLQTTEGLEQHLPHVEKPALGINKVRKPRQKKSNIVPAPFDEDESHTADEHVLNDVASAVQRSAYFSKTTPSALVDGATKSVEMPHEALPALTHGSMSGNVELASRRRRSWTPAKDSAVLKIAGSPSIHGTKDANSPPDTPQPRLTDILGGFGYVSPHAEQILASERTATGEASAKRRRVEVSNKVAAKVVMRELPEGVAVVKPLKRRKEPKKPQTITALATAAFQQQKEPEAEQSVVSEYFAPRADPVLATTNADKLEVQTSVAKKPRQCRKSRIKKIAADGTTIPQKPRKVGKPAKAKPPAVQQLSPLYSPSKAITHMEQQGFLFGTSSQLAVDESPEFIQDMQMALRESELSSAHARARGVAYGGPMSSPAQVTVSPLRAESCVRVPTAPHGTCLSLVQAERNFWCAGTRGYRETLYREPRRQHERGKQPVGWPGKSMSVLKAVDSCPAVSPATNLGTSESQDTGATREMEGSAMDKRDDAGIVDDPQPLPVEPGVLHECSLSVQEYDKPNDDDHKEGLPDKIMTNDLLPPIVNENDSWMVLSSDEPEVPAADRETSKTDPTRPSGVPHGMGKPVIVSVSAAMRTPSPPPRPALQVLDANINLSANLSPLKACNNSRALSTSTSLHARKGKEAIESTASTVAKAVESNLVPPVVAKRRGRPPKQPALASDPPRQQPVIKPKLPKAKIASGGSPASRSRRWLDIDEISDSDSPVTPSPPRRRAASSPSTIQPLQLSPSRQTAATTSVPAAATATVKPDGPQWPTIRTTLFPLITTTIKSSDPQLSDSSTFSWWDRILLYDPIVVEDLTLWLNTQGLTINVSKPKPVPRKKGRKRKDAAEEDEAVEWETFAEPLQPWMVQKWCEEKSICCYLREGSWRAGRNRS